MAELLEGGKSGILVKNGDSHELAKAIVALSDMPAKRHQLSLRGLEWVKEFDLRNTISRFEEILSRLTKSNLSEAKVLSAIDNGSSASV
jgi:glycosyltransferase involved in cell wall biosynthesis